jgi:hypothetical protein
VVQERYGVAEEAKVFTSTYDNFIQTAGIRDGASHYAKILSVFYDSLDTSDPTDLEKFQEARAVAYADGGYIKGKLSERSAAGVSRAKACTQRRCRAGA